MSDSQAPDYVDIHLMRHDGLESDRRVYVTEINGSITLDLYSGWCLEGEELKYKLQSLPVKVCTMTALERLWVSHNNLTALPGRIDQLTNLRELFLHHNNITVLPPRLFGLPKLQILWLSSNHIKEVPSEISQMKTLKRLHLDHNDIELFPEGVCELTQLEVLYLNHNHITSIPEGIGQLVNLRRLSLHFNKITSIPDALCSMTELQLLNIQSNKISSKPRDFDRYCRQLEGNNAIIQTANNPFVLPMRHKLSVTSNSPVMTTKATRRHSEQVGHRDRANTEGEVRTPRISVPFVYQEDSTAGLMDMRKKSATLR